MFFAHRRVVPRRRANAPLAVLRVETLEARTVPASMTLRVAVYNIAASDVAPRTGLDAILQAIGNEATYAPARPIDVLALQEVQSQSTTSQAVVNLLNSIYGPNTYARGTLNGSSTGAGTQGLVYRTSTVQLVGEYVVPIPPVNIGGTNYTPLRAPIRYELKPIGGSAADTFYIYNSHYKADTGSSDQNLRQAEAIDIRADADALGQGKNILYVGDFNAYSSAETFYSTTLLGPGNGQAFDPIDRPGAWHSFPNSFVDVLTQAPSNSPPAGFTGGGLDDRFDFQLVSGELLDGIGLEYVPGSYHTFGNNGSVAANGNINRASSTALPGLANRTTVLNYLTTVTDHLPVVADYSFSVSSGTPTIGSFAVSPATVAPGTSVTLTASNVSVTSGSIASVKFYRESNGTAGLQVGGDTFVGAGTQNGSTWTLATSTTGFQYGAYTYFAVATDALNASGAAASTTLTVANPASSGPILGWDVAGQTAFGTQGLAAGLVALGITNSMGLTRGSGVSTNPTAAGNAWGGNGWAATSADGIAGNDFAAFGLTVAAGYTASLSSIDLNYRRSTTAPANGFWQFQINGGAWTDIGDFANEFPVNTSTGGAITPIGLGNIVSLQNMAAGTVVNLRLVPYGSATGNWYVNDSSGNDLVVSGTIAPAAPTTTTLTATPLATTGGSLVMFTATVAPSPGALGTVSFLDGSGVIPGGANIPLSGGVAAFSTTTLAVGSHAITASYSGATGFLSSVSSARTVVIGTQPRVLNVAVNGNIDALAGPQRSRVASLVVTFDQPVELDPNAFTLDLHKKNVAIAGDARPLGYGTLPNSLSRSTTDNINWVIGFVGNTEHGGDGVESLADGVYDLTVNAALVHPLGVPAIAMAADATTTFHRLFGDSDAPATTSGAPGVDFAAIVNPFDSLAFLSDFNTSPNTNAAFDFNGDGVINPLDYISFLDRFNKALTWSE